VTPQKASPEENGVTQLISQRSHLSKPSHSMSQKNVDKESLADIGDKPNVAKQAPVVDVKYKKSVEAAKEAEKKKNTESTSRLKALERKMPALGVQTTKSNVRFNGLLKNDKSIYSRQQQVNSDGTKSTHVILN
jgi:uncharacterized protein YhaN